MAVALEAAVDVGAIMGAIVLLGMLVAMYYTILPVVRLLNVSIVGIRPFHFLYVIAHNTLIRWLENGIHAMEGVVAALWYGLGWSINEMIVSLRLFANGIEHTFHAFRHVVLPRVIRAVEAPLMRRVLALERRLLAAETHIRWTEQHIAHGTAVAASTTYRRLQGLIRGAVIGPAEQFEQRIAAVERTLEAELGRVPGEIARDSQTVAGRLHDLDRVAPIATIAGLTAAFPLVRASVRALEAEAGLNVPRCRQNVKQLCGVNPNGLLQLIAGLAILETGLSLRRLVPVARRGINELIDHIERAA